MRGARVLAAAVLAALTAGAARAQETGPIPDDEIRIEVIPGAEEVDLGRAFPLTVVRAWSRELLPEAWTERALAPLEVRLVETRRREDSRHVEETRVYEAYAFALGEVTIPAPVFRARPRDGGRERATIGEDVTLRVRTALDPASPGPPEFPGDPLPRPEPEPSPWWVPWSIGGAVAVLALGLGAWALHRRAARRRMPAVVEEAVPPPPPAHARALARLRRLRERRVQSRDEIESCYLEASAVLREYLGERFSLRTRERTTEEVLAAPQTARVLAPPHRALVGEVLAECDLVKFARHLPPPSERDRVLDSAEEFLLQTGNGKASEPAADTPAAGSAGS